MKNKEVIKQFAKKYNDLYIIEYVTSSLIPNKDLAIEEFNNLNKKCVDEARLYKVDDNEIVLIQKY